MQECKWARIIPDRKAIWLSDILNELLEAGWITEDEYYYPYISIFNHCPNKIT